MDSRVKTAKTVGYTPRIYGAFEITECVLTSAASSLAPIDEEKNVDVSLALVSSQVVLPKQSPFNYFRLAPMKSLQQLQLKEKLK